MRIVQILRELNISLTSLNQEMKFLRLPEFQLNDKVSDADYSFIKEYFQSEEMKELEILIQRVNDQRMLLKKIFLKTNKGIDNMGLLEKMQLFYYLKKQDDSITKPKVEVYSEANLLKLYNWYINWAKLSKVQQKEREEIIETQLEENRRLKELNEFNVVDEEDSIMSALSNGYGDVYGF